MFPGNPRYWQRNPGTKSKRVLSKEMVILRKRRNPPNTVLSVRNTAEPNLSAILEILGSTRKTELSRKDP